jgi:hypothetical protein
MKISNQINTEVAEKMNCIVSKTARLPRLGRDIEAQPGTSGNHLKVSSMVSENIHIFLSANSIIISVVLALLVKKSDQTTYLVYPTVFLLSVLLMTICFPGEVLAEKKRYLNIGYKVFIFSLIASLLALGLSFFLTH